jgi:hypothetical protein
MDVGKWMVAPVLLATWGLAVGATIWLAGQTSPYLPKYDDWPTMVPVLTGHRPITARWLWEPLGPHRIPLARLAYLAAFHASGGDFRAGQFLSVCLLGMTALLGMGLARHWRGKSSLADAFFPLILLHWGQSQLFLLGIVLNFTLCIALNYCALFLLLRAGNQFNRIWGLLLACCLLGQSLSGTVGVLMAVPYVSWFGGAVWLHLRRGQGSWKATALYLGSLGILAAIVAAPLVGLCLQPAPSQALENADRPLLLPVQNLAVITSMSLGWLAKSFFLPSLMFMLALSLATAAWLAFVFRTRPQERIRSSALLIFMGGTIPVLASLGYGRAFVTGEELWATTRYAALSVPLLVAAFLASFFLRRHRAIAQGLLCALGGVIFVGNAVEVRGYPYARQPLVHIRSVEDSLIRSVLSGNSLEQAAHAFFRHENHYGPQQGAEWLVMLRDMRLGLFGMSEGEQRKVLGWWQADRGTPLVLRRRDSESFLGDGWSVHGNPEGRWTCDGRALVRFQVTDIRPYQLTICLLPFVVPGKLDRQRVSLALNGHELMNLVLDRWDWQNVTVPLPVHLLRSNNTLEFYLPDTVAPKAIGYNHDPEPHSVLVQRIEIR